MECQLLLPRSPEPSIIISVEGCVKSTFYNEFKNTMRNILLLLIFLFFTGLAGAQNFVSSTYLGAKTKAELIAQFGVPFLQYDVRYYKMTYTSKDAAGVLDTLSGLVVVPADLNNVYPLLVYQHGTADCKTCVPSRYGSPGGGEGDVGLVFAGMGYISFLPDYVGMGDGRGFHPYVHAATEAAAALDMIRARGGFFGANAGAVPYSQEQLFITGYSQGGHAAMALHREIETNLPTEFTVTAAAGLSGPYSVSGVMRDLILSEDVYYYPAYIPNTALSYQTVYGNLFNTLTDIFKPEYATFIQQYYDGVITLGTLNESLIQTLTTLTGASVARRMLQESAIQAVENTPSNPINVALKDNDVYDWAPTAPTRIFYCTGDDQVPFRNSIVARDTMTANGAVDLAAMDVNTTADHSGCVVPALLQTIFFFGSKQDIQIIVNNTEQASAFVINVAPNPVDKILYVNDLVIGVSLRLIDWKGQEVYAANKVTAVRMAIPARDLPAGIYALQVIAADGKVGVTQVVVQH